MVAAPRAPDQKPPAAHTSTHTTTPANAAHTTTHTKRTTPPHIPPPHSAHHQQHRRSHDPADHGEGAESARQPSYQDLARRRLLYTNDAIHVGVLQLVLQLLLTPGGMLDLTYIARFHQEGLP